MKKTIHYYQREHATFLGRLRSINREIPALREAYNAFAKEVKLPVFSKDTIKKLALDTALHFCEVEINGASSRQHIAVRKFFLEHFYKMFNDLKSAWQPIDRAINQMNDREREAFANATYTIDGAINIDQFKEASLPFFEVTIETKEDFTLLEKYNSVAHAWNAFLDHIQRHKITRNNIHMATINQLYDISDFSKRAKKKPEILF